ncbi:MAG: hypothetical protein JKY53_14790 [Flavobacteriales bacterium]|nr:hypothetical protein [Flavobacteriales bacterium]
MQLTPNTRAFIEAEQYSSFILTNLHDGLLPTVFYRDVSDFMSGATLHVKTIGTVTIQEAAEDTPLVYNAIDTGEVTLTITDFEGDAWHVTDVLRQDGAQIEQLMAERGVESTRALQESFETKFLKACNDAQTDANANTINSFAHRIASTETNNVLALSDLIKMKVAFDKANVPYGGRVAILDPIVGATLDGLVTITQDVTPFGQKILENGFERDHQFLMNLYGWNIITSNRLDKGSLGDGTTTVTDGVANIFMSMMDDNHKPIMVAWRQQPSVEGERNKDRARDEFVTRQRYGIGPQRVDTLGIYITDATKF